MLNLEFATQKISQLSKFTRSGKVTKISGNIVQVKGISHFAGIGSLCSIVSSQGNKINAEVIGASDQMCTLMTFATTKDITIGMAVLIEGASQEIRPHKQWAGRIIDAFAKPIDGKGPLIEGEKSYPLHGQPLLSSKRRRINRKIDTGIKAINVFAPMCYGQRMGIFAGSGVGKSMLTAMIAKFAKSDVKVIGLIGERGREVREFIEDYLGPEGLAQSTLVVCTSDESALAKKRAANLTMTIAEFYRDCGMETVCIMDSITRFAMAQREIGLYSGEVPTSKGYTASVFTELPKLLERAGPGITSTQGNITGLFSVLVEGDDHNDPIADAVRAIIDGHIILDREIADSGRYPAMNILKSVSRMLPGCNTTSENEALQKARQNIAIYDDMKDMIKIGAYKKGSNKKIDVAIKLSGKIENYISQPHNQYTSIEESYQKLNELVDT